MRDTIKIINPISGSSGYTSARKAAEYVRRGRAVIDDGKLRFLDRDGHSGNGPESAVSWDGSPLPPLLRRLDARHTTGNPPAHRPGEVRS